ncbi:Cna B-type domain-containing protein [Companilactobacillus sp. FL22-1]|uniref:Cna B-type domain-containing protein n=1 Tax=Companilactobacillus sp. FL22-1 TaxID=3373892 RepID=UPI0037545CA9
MSIFMTSSVNIVKATDDSNSAGTAGKDWGSELITKAELQNSEGKSQSSFGKYEDIRAYWEFKTPTSGVHANDTMNVTVPEQLTITGDITEGQPIYDLTNGKQIGTATLKKGGDIGSGTVTITFNQEAETLSKNGPVSGSFYVSTNWNLNEVSTENPIHLDWNIKGTVTPDNPDYSMGTGTDTGTGNTPSPTEVLYKYGSYVGSGDTILWTVRVNYKGETIANASYKDTIGPNQELLTDQDHPIKVNSASTDSNGNLTNDTDNAFKDLKPAIAADKSTFTINFGNLEKTAIITYYTKITNPDNKSTSYANTGDLLSDHDEIQNITINQPTTTIGSDAKSTDEITSIMGHKIWKVPSGTAIPEKIVVDLNCNGKKKDSQTVTKDTNWSYVFYNLPKYDENGDAYHYTVSEEPVDGFIAITDPTNYDIKNVLPEMKVKKIWHDGNNYKNRPGSITVGVYDGNHKSYGTISLNDDNEWSNSLPISNADPYLYVSEIDQPYNYISTQTINNGNDYDKTITNTLAVPFTVTKKWVDDNASDRPESIQIQLIQLNKNNEPVGDPVTLDSNNKWTYTFKGLPLFDASDNEIKYSAKEISMPNGYKSNSSEVNYNKDKNLKLLSLSQVITNTLNSPTTPTTNQRSFTVTKRWNDDNDKDKLRPTKVEVQLTADGKNSGAPVILNEQNNWSYTWDKLDKQSNNTDIQYSVKEVTVPGYTSNLDVVDGGVQITNTHTPETTTNPDVPTTPTTPTTPTIPSVPNQTEHPETPLNPTGSNDQKTPGLPSNPLIPSTPSQPNTPVNSTDKKGSLLPQTGTKEAAGIYSLLGLLTLGFALYLFKKKI